jgi:hypothetical protein
LTLALSGISYQDAGSYSLYATNSSSLENSSAAATLTVNDPYIITPPANPAAIAGGNATFSVSANGSATITYQWYENGTQLSDGNPTATGTATVSGSQTSTLTLTGVQDADNGSYTCTVTGSNSGQSVTTVPAILTVQDALTVVSAPLSRTERVGDHLAFTVGVAGGGPSYQWYSNSVAIAGATNSALALANIQPSFGATYSVTVQNLATPAQSYPATLTVINSAVLNLASTNLIVSRVGDGAQTLSGATGNTIYLDQYATNGAYLNTAQVPDEAAGSPYGTGSSASVPNSPALLVQGAGADAGYEAMLSLSFVNQEYLCFAGYCEQYPFSGSDVTVGGSTFPTLYARGLGTINAFGAYSLAYTNSGLYSAGNHTLRGVATLDAVNFWTVGQANSGTVKFVNINNSAYASGSGIPSSTGVSGTGGRAIQIVNGPLPVSGFSSVSNLVCSDATGSGGSYGLFAATGNIEPGSGANISFTPLLNTGGGQPGDFAFSPDNLTVYIADAGDYTGSGNQGTGGIQRWDSNGNGWSYSYTLGVLPGEVPGATTPTNGAQGLVADFSANAAWGSRVTGAKIYVTTFGESTNSLVEVIDNGDPSATPATINVLATAAPNTAFRGVRFGPAVVLPYIVTAPQSQTNFPGNSMTFSAAAAGSGPLSYQWLQNDKPLSNGADPLNAAGGISGATTSTLTVSNISLADNNSQYSVKVSNPNSQSVTSAVAILTVTAGAPKAATLPSYTETEGDHVGWQPVVAGTVPMTYAWHFGANTVASGTITSLGSGGSLVLTNIQVANSGDYVFDVTNLYGNASSTGALTVTATKQLLSSNNLVVARLGDSVQTLSGVTGNTLYLDQYTTAGSYVSSIQIPDEGTGQAYGTGSSASTNLPPGSPAVLFAGAGADAGYEAFLTLSPNGEALSFAGYCEAYPFLGSDVSYSSGNGGNAWRGIAEVDAYGYYTLSWTNTGLYSGGNHQVHCAVDVDGNGTNWYTTGEAGGGDGIKYCNTDVEPASGLGVVGVAGSYPGTRVVQIAAGNLVFSDTGDNGAGIYACSGLPTTTVGTNLMIADPSSPMDFAASPDLNTVYIADNGTFTGTGATNGGIQRWDANGTSPYGYPTYALTYTLATGTGSTVGARGLAVDFSAHTTWGAGVTGTKLYATTAESSGNRLIQIVDNGSGSGATTLVTAGANELLGGVRFGPAVVAPSFAVQPQDTTAITGSAASLSAEALGSGPLTYQWYFQANGSGSFVALSGATNATYTIAGAGSRNVGNYYVVATNPGGLMATSQPPASLSLAAPPQFVSEVILGLGSGLQLNFTGPANFGYTLWSSTDVKLTPVASTWTKLTTGTFSGGTDSYTDPNGGADAANPQTFYVITVP